MCANTPRRPWSRFTPKLSLTNQTDGCTATSIRQLWTFITYKGLKTQHEITKKAFVLCLVAAERKGMKRSSLSFLYRTSPPLTGPYVLQCCFVRAGQTRDPCEEPALIMHEPRLPGENTTRAGKRGKEERREAQKARFTLIPGLASF